ncbi:MAG: galactokinase [Lentisphaerae bacterium]|nr:galactokinase [Lentisphaerota bacterium]
MTKDTLHQKAAAKFREAFEREPAVAAYAPGRVEVLGNHTDYNEGFVLSAAIDCGTCFIAAPTDGTTCRLVAGDLMEMATFSAERPTPSRRHSWANYVIGVVAGVGAMQRRPKGFDGLFLSNVPLGAGLSSSAALEVSAGMALSALHGVTPSALDLARIGQRAEHDYAGVKCGLLDQISSLFGEPDRLVMTDFRSLKVETVPLGTDAAFLMCRTHARHALVDGEYNARRHHCEEAARHFATVLPHPVTALRDVSWAEWEQHRDGLNPLAARRAAHPIGENDRVRRGRQCLADGNLAAFGQLMYESHESSQKYFENSCEQLDAVVAAARQIPLVLGARLSGGGFGGSAVVLIHPRDVEVVSVALQKAYQKVIGHPCDIRAIRASGGAHMLDVTAPAAAS